MSMSILDGQSVLVTGGSGSLGRAFIPRARRDSPVRRRTVFSPHEQKHYPMARAPPAPRLRCSAGGVPARVARQNARYRVLHSRRGPSTPPKLHDQSPGPHLFQKRRQLLAVGRARPKPFHQPADAYPFRVRIFNYTRYFAGQVFADFYRIIHNLFSISG